MPSNATIRCARCGFDNEPGHLYCAKCKVKLNLAQISSKSFAKSGKHADIRVQILQFILLAIIICFTLALWPVQIDGTRMSGAEFAKARNKMIQLQKGVAADPVEFSESEINMLFDHLLLENRRRTDFKAESVSVDAGRVIISPEMITVYLHYRIGPWAPGLIEIGPFWLTYAITGRPEPGADGLRFAALNGSLGHLPLPFLGGRLGTKFLKRFFIPFKNARVFLSRLEIAGMQKGSIKVNYAK